MGYKCGMPVLKLDRLNHFGNKSKRSGNARAVACEALEERWSSDPDVDRSKTKDNVYFGKFTSGSELTAYWEQLANEYRVVSKNGKQRKLRADAGIGLAGIIKPVDEFMDTLSPDEQERFLREALDEVGHILEKYGLEFDAAVLQVDERNKHVHWFAHDPEYQLGRKLGLRFYGDLNRTFPEAMQRRGWPIDKLHGWQEETEGMTPEEKAEYGEKKRKSRKQQHGRSSAQYKAEKELEKKEKALEAKEAELKAWEEKLEQERKSAVAGTKAVSREHSPTVEDFYKNYRGPVKPPVRGSTRGPVQVQRPKEWDEGFSR